MHDFTKKSLDGFFQTNLKTIQKGFGAAAFVALSASPALADCIVNGNQHVPTYNRDSFHFKYTFSGSPLETLKQCLQQSFNNEEIAGRDVTGNKMTYTSSARGNFSMTGYAEQPNDDLVLTNKPGNSVAIARIHNESGVDGLANGNIAELSQNGRKLEIYPDWAAFQRQSPHAAKFAYQP